MYVYIIYIYMGWMGQVPYEILIGDHPFTNQLLLRPQPAARANSQGQEFAMSLEAGRKSHGKSHVFFPAKSWYPPVN
jgi:hypothetical protein